MIFSVLYAIKGVFLISVQMTPLQCAFPKLALNPQAMCSLFFFPSIYIVFRLLQSHILNNQGAYAFVVAYNFFLRHVDLDWIIRMNIDAF